MDTQKREAMASLAMMAALADRTLTMEERASLTKIMDSLPEENRIAIYRKVFRGEASIEEELSQLDSETLRTRGYTLVNEICQSDGVLSKKEREFLTRLRTSMAFSTVLQAGDR